MYQNSGLYKTKNMAGNIEKSYPGACHGDLKTVNIMLPPYLASDNYRHASFYIITFTKWNTYIVGDTKTNTNSLPVAMRQSNNRKTII